jgi:hypothetical protein
MNSEIFRNMESTNVEKQLLSRTNGDHYNMGPPKTTKIPNERFIRTPQTTLITMIAGMGVANGFGFQVRILGIIL